MTFDQVNDFLPPIYLNQLSKTDDKAAAKELSSDEMKIAAGLGLKPGGKSFAAKRRRK